MIPRRALICDLFCGAGGLSLGFHAAGGAIRTMVDHDAIAASTAHRNLNVVLGEDTTVLGGPQEGDLDQIDLLEFHSPGELDILLGGPPCQAFSLAGRAKLIHLRGNFAEDPRNHLYLRFRDALENLRPRSFVMENVAGMMNVHGVNLAEGIARELAGCGYRVGYNVLNAARYGVPQFRERIFFIGFRRDLEIDPCLPKATHSARTNRTTDIPSGYNQSDLDQTPLLPGMEEQTMHLNAPMRSDPLPAVTVSEALDDLPVIKSHLDGIRRRGQRNFRERMEHRIPPHSDFARLMREDWPLLAGRPYIMDHCVRRTPRDFETFRLMKHGDRYPQAVVIARNRFDSHLDGLGGAAPLPDTPEFEELKARFIPPYGLKNDYKHYPDRWRKLYPEEPSWTLPAHLSKDSYSHIHHDSDQARMISVREAARLQSFPDAFQFDGNLGDCFRQIGNAVPPLLAWHIGARILEALGMSFTPAPNSRDRVC
ncbi:MAG: DNA cytosine methyltransferase [Planctomycetota bacterium]|nr:DNA cytosine methyltransferase [Planctomycetota bacterium]